MQYRSTFIACALFGTIVAACHSGAGNSDVSDDVSQGGQAGTETGGNGDAAGANAGGGAGATDAQGGTSTGGIGGTVTNGGTVGTASTGGASMTTNTGGTMATGGNNTGGNNTGGNNTGGTPVGTGDDPPAGWVRAAVAVGYAGRCALTRDYGVTWVNKSQLAPSGGDDENLLRGVAYGKGQWVAVGWKHLVSKDANTWTVVKRLNACGLMEDIAFGNGVWVGTCGDDAYVSTDGISFTRGGHIGNAGGHTYIQFAKGQFVASGGSGSSFKSTDGKTWTAMTQRRVWFCNDDFRTEDVCGGAAWADGHYVRDLYPKGFQHSTDGTNWISAGPGRSSYRVTFGYAPPN